MNLSHSATRDVSARFASLKSTKLYDFTQDPCHKCVLSGIPSSFKVTRDTIADLRMSGCTIAMDFLSVTSYDVAYIMGMHFRAGEWGQKPRCGSVITCVMDGQSLYARVHKFLHVEGDDCPGYAFVSWFSEPRYWFPDNELVVVVGLDDGGKLSDIYGNVIRITQIDPSQVMVEDDSRMEGYFMMRDSGYDTRRSEE